MGNHVQHPLSVMWGAGGAPRWTSAHSTGLSSGLVWLHLRFLRFFFLFLFLSSSFLFLLHPMCTYMGQPNIVSTGMGTQVQK